AERRFVDRADAAGITTTFAADRCIVDRHRQSHLTAGMREPSNTWFEGRGWRGAASGQRLGYEHDDTVLMSKQLWNVCPLSVTSDVILPKSNASCSLIDDVDDPNAVLATTTSSKV